MFFRIKNLFEQGGIEIITPSVARTVIQPDGDVIMFVNKKMFGNPQALQKHFNKITRLLSTLNVFRKWRKFLDSRSIASTTTISNFPSWASASIR